MRWTAGCVFAPTRQGDVRAERAVFSGERFAYELTLERAMKVSQALNVAANINPQHARRAGGAELARGTELQGPWAAGARGLAADTLQPSQLILRLLAEKGHGEVHQVRVNPSIGWRLVCSEATEDGAHLAGQFNGEEQSHRSGRNGPLLDIPREPRWRRGGAQPLNVRARGADNRAEQQRQHGQVGLPDTERLVHRCAPKVHVDGV
jgi:hypothetical protein